MKASGKQNWIPVDPLKGQVAVAGRGSLLGDAECHC
jgi:hypothetical protein